MGFVFHAIGEPDGHDVIPRLHSLQGQLDIKAAQPPGNSLLQKICARSVVLRVAEMNSINQNFDVKYGVYFFLIDRPPTNCVDVEFFDPCFEMLIPISMLCIHLRRGSNIA